MSADERYLLTDLLRSVSRAFYLTIRVLPRDLREPVGLAYLLARAADTIADTTVLPPNERSGHLLAFRARIQEQPGAKLDGIAELTDRQGNPDEQTLLRSLEAAFGVLEAMSGDDARRVRSVVSTLTEGMQLDLETFPAEDSGRVVAFERLGELDRYTYLVAGCVGEFWTDVSMAHTPALAGWDRARMEASGVRFGKALQMTNILRDVPGDLRIGRCYLPREELSAHGLAPEDLLDPSNASRARPVLAAGLRNALEHYRFAEAYLLSIPRRCYRLRLSVVWPILIGLATLELLARNSRWLDPANPSKVTRPWVYRTMALSMIAEPSDAVLKGWIARQRRRVEAVLT